MRYLVLAVVAAVAVPAAGQEKKKKEIPLPPDSFYALKTRTLEGQPADLKDYAGQVALVVNLASQ